MGVDDGKLLREFARTGAEPAFAQIVHRHATTVFGVCRGALGNSADAEDAAQATFLTLAQKARSLAGHRSISGWLHRVAWHIAMRARQARQRRETHEREAAAMLARKSQESSAGGESPELVLLNDELDRLPQRYRVPLILHHLEGLSESESAKRLGCAVGTLSGRLSRGRQMLRERISARSRAASAGALSAAAVAALFADQTRASVVPAGFEESVSRPAALLAAGHSAAQAHTSARAAALTEAAIRMLFLARLRVAAAMILLAILIATGIAVTARHSLGHGNDRAAVQSGDLLGKLVDPRDQPVSRATIRLYASRAQANANARPLAVAQSNDDGTFKLTELPPAKGYFLLCFKAQPTFMHAEVDPVEVLSTQAKDLGVIRMIEGRY